jgi:hypothetical protein
MQVIRTFQELQIWWKQQTKQLVLMFKDDPATNLQYKHKEKDLINGVHA